MSIFLSFQSKFVSDFSGTVQATIFTHNAHVENERLYLKIRLRLIGSDFLHFSFLYLHDNTETLCIIKL